MRFWAGATYEFQFTHPGRGATTACPTRSPRLCCFNSRTPGGVRPSSREDPQHSALFQFTHPGRGATVVPLYLRTLGTFQFTHPGRGATRRYISFISTTDVSIHAPREGCDLLFRKPLKDAVLFQFTHPGRGATTSISVGILFSLVSIHAPREGCDASVVC